MQNNQNFNRPYSNEYLFFNEISGHYELTEKALIERVGVNLRARMSETALISPERVRS